jgi:hypothetical protein
VHTSKSLTVCLTIFSYLDVKIIVVFIYICRRKLPWSHFLIFYVFWRHLLTVHFTTKFQHE